jgi:hypothetical protein
VKARFCRRAKFVRLGTPMCDRVFPYVGAMSHHVDSNDLHGRLARPSQTDCAVNGIAIRYCVVGEGAAVTTPLAVMR